MKKINTSVDTTIYRNHKKLFELIKNNKNAKDIARNMFYKNCTIYIDKEKNNLIDIELKFVGNEQNYPEIIFILSSDSKNLKIKSSSFNQISYKEYIRYIEDHQQIAMDILRAINIIMVS